MPLSLRIAPGMVNVKMLFEVEHAWHWYLRNHNYRYYVDANDKVLDNIKNEEVCHDEMHALKIKYEDFVD